MFKLKECLQNGEIYTIAEMSANHAGKIENAFKIINEAKKAGAKCVKIQTYTADTLTINCRNDFFKMNGGLWDGCYLYDLYNKAYTPWEWQKDIKAECDRVGIDFLSTPFDKTAVDFLESIGCEAYKIASFEIVDIPLIEYVASKHKPMIISCGMASEAEIQDALDACKRNNNDDIVLLKCCSEYPSKLENLNLTVISDMKNKYPVTIGLSDHSMGHLADVVAVSLGARVIEKHFCLSRTIKNADSDFSMEPEEFKLMVEKTNDALKSIGTIKYGPSKDESEEYKCRRSLFVVKDVKAGEVFTEENVRSIRPANGLAPKMFSDVIGKTAKTDIAFGTPLSLDLIANE